MRLLFCLFLTFTATVAFSQSDALAKNYFEQGQYEKAAAIYEKLYESSPNRNDYLLSLVSSYQQLERYEEAENLLNTALKRTNNSPPYLIELGHNLTLQKKTEEAEKYYLQALQSIEQQSGVGYSVGYTFEKYNLLDYAVSAYEKTMEKSPNMDFNTQLARIYGEQGNLEKMFDSYLHIVEKNPGYLPIVQRNFSAYITEDPTNDANIMLRKALLRKSQSNPDILYNDLLSWLFVQQEEYEKAFTQQKAIYRRTTENLQGLVDLALITMEKERNELAREVLLFIIENSPADAMKLEAYQYVMQIDVKTTDKKEYPEVEKKFENLIRLFENRPETFGLQIDYNNFLAFRQGKKDQAIKNLQDLSQEKLSRYQEARVLMELADILAFDEKFNEALIYYSRIQNKVKNDPISQEARFKVARTSYFKGDFAWALTQLDILKKSTSQLIANDAMEMSLLIRDNSLEDSTQTALKAYAKADLLQLQNKDTEAILLLDNILKNHKGESIEDEALYKQAIVFEKTKQYEKAIANYLQIIEFHNQDILADNAFFRLGEIYNKHLRQPEKAKEYYEKIIFNHQDSIFFVEARQQFRSIRGDAIN